MFTLSLHDKLICCSGNSSLAIQDNFITYIIYKLETHFLIELNLKEKSSFQFCTFYHFNQISKATHKKIICT